jgi:hypothetical protein
MLKPMQEYKKSIPDTANQLIPMLPVSLKIAKGIRAQNIAPNAEYVRS